MYPYIPNSGNELYNAVVHSTDCKVSVEVENICGYPSSFLFEHAFLSSFSQPTLLEF